MYVESFGSHMQGTGGCVRGGGDNDGNKQVAEGTSGCTKGGPFRIDL